LILGWLSGCIGLSPWPRAWSCRRQAL